MTPSGVEQQRPIVERPARSAPLPVLSGGSSQGYAGEAAARVLASQEFVATVRSAPPECCIDGADGYPWPCRSVLLVAFRFTAFGGDRWTAHSLRLQPSTRLWERWKSANQQAPLNVAQSESGVSGRRRS